MSIEEWEKVYEHRQTNWDKLLLGVVLDVCRYANRVARKLNTAKRKSS